MKNNLNIKLSSAVATQITLWLDYVDGAKLRLITSHFNIDPMTDDKYDYGCYLDSILYYCNDSLDNSINVLNFINNNYK